MTEIDMGMALARCRGVVNERHLVTVLTHFCIHEGKIYGSNGRVSMEAPFPVLRDEPIVVPAGPFYKAVDKCEGDPIIEIHDEFLTVKSKVRKMRRIRLPLSLDNYSKPFTTGDRYEMPKFYDTALMRMRHFVSKDASRPWAMSILHQDGYLYATNNIVLVRTEFDWHADLPIFGLPGFAADEVIRLGTPDYIWVSENNVSFEYPGGVWLRSVLYEATWPDVASMIPDTSNLPPLPKDFREVTRDMIPFNEDDKFPVVKYDGKIISTLEGGMIAEDELEEGVAEAAFHAVPLTSVLDVATHMDLSPYPKPCPFRGPAIEGVIVGVRV